MDLSCAQRTHHRSTVKGALVAMESSLRGKDSKKCEKIAAIVGGRLFSGETDRCITRSSEGRGQWQILSYCLSAWRKQVEISSMGSMLEGFKVQVAMCFLAKNSTLLAQRAMLAWRCASSLSGRDHFGEISRSRCFLV
eukprot:symbB.v1.2.002078.t1/scaffold111.1/size324890/12